MCFLCPQTPLLRASHVTSRVDTQQQHHDMRQHVRVRRSQSEKQPKSLSIVDVTTGTIYHGVQPVSTSNNVVVFREGKSRRKTGERSLRTQSLTRSRQVRAAARANYSDSDDDVNRRAVLSQAIRVQSLPPARLQSQQARRAQSLPRASYVRRSAEYQQLPDMPTTTVYTERTLQPNSRINATSAISRDFLLTSNSINRATGHNTVVENLAPPRQHTTQQRTVTTRTSTRHDVKHARHEPSSRNADVDFMTVPVVHGGTSYRADVRADV